MLRSATVVYVASPAAEPSIGRDVMRVLTDRPPASERAFYLRLGEPEPPVGVTIAYGDAHATWVVNGREVTARKVGVNFDRTQAWAKEGIDLLRGAWLAAPKTLEA